MRSLTATVNGVSTTVSSPATVLDACRASGVAVVSLCSHPSLSSAPSCNSCHVIVNGNLVRACAEPLRPGAAINTIGSAAVGARGQSLAKLSLGHPVACSTCHQSGGCELQDGLVANGPVRVEQPMVPRRSDATNSKALGSAIALHLDLCVGCTRCTRFAAEVLHRPIMSLQASQGRAANLKIDESASFGVPYALAFVELCPVGVFEHRNQTLPKVAPWNQHSAASVCAGCATGCPIFLHGNDSGVQRVSSRGGAHFLCDDGYQFFRKRSVPRLAVPLTAHVAASWDRALAAAAALLAPSLNEGSLAVVFSAESSTEDLAALSAFAVQRAAAAFTYSYVNADGVAAPPLMNANKNPNAAVLKALAPNARPLNSLARDIADGKITSVLCLGVDSVTTDSHPDLFEVVGKLSALVVASSFEGPLTLLAKVALPLATIDESSGSFVNAAGVAQSFSPLSSPAGDALPGWDVVNHLSRLLGIELELESFFAVSAWLKRHHHRLCTDPGRSS
jgi:NADH-quinone oxidoreductase subunit G